MKQLNEATLGELGHPLYLHGECKVGVIKSLCAPTVFFVTLATPLKLADFYKERNQKLLEEILWTPKNNVRGNHELVKKDAGRVAQRRTDNKRRMRRQLPDDAYVWETDTSLGMG